MHNVIVRTHALLSAALAVVLVSVVPVDTVQSQSDLLMTMAEKLEV